ncbi:DUF1573 domain-containing protein [Foetidibacter luteolus]|uniref:DUF1573 domain-containing protein n=1 Tax=Foetidibacter luteolus TaxID=2608880 RepID=UPI00129B4A1F|nr:DUF1573 domain-containing protein [Foetidibacter luteolus]
MKKISLLVSAMMFLLFVNANAQAQAPAIQQTNQPDVSKVIQFSELDHNFGKIPFGKPVEYDLVLKNISSDSVRLESAQPSCGCTTPKYKNGPYAPGESFKVTLGFNGMTDGAFTKTVTLIFGNGIRQVVKFHGETFKAPENAAPANAAVQKLKDNK